MNIKSLLIGSAAALVAVSGARAADAIVAAEPEPVEYVRVCDAFGTGYFYIPGTETCLKIGGYARVENKYSNVKFKGADAATFMGGLALAINLDNAAKGIVGPLVKAPKNKSSFSQTTRARVDFTAKSDTEYGVLEGFMALQGNDGAIGVDEVYLALGGFKAGYFTHWNDRGIAGETDSMAGANTKFNSIMYSGNAGSFKYGVSLDQVNGSWYNSTKTPKNMVGVSGMIGATVGAVDADVVAYYDASAKEWGARFLAQAALGSGKLGVMAVYNDGASGYFAGTDLGFGDSFSKGKSTVDDVFYAEWVAAVSYQFQVNEKLKLTPGLTYSSYKFDRTNALANATGVTGTVGTSWKGGLTADYKITTGLDLKATVNYEQFKSKAGIDVKQDNLSGFIRLQRSF